MDWRKYVVDTGASQVWGLTIGSATEAASGMTLEQIVRSRSMMFVMNAFAGGPYGKWRDFVLRSCEYREDAGSVRKVATEGLAMTTFYTPIYAGLNAAFNNADWKTVGVSAAAGAAMGLLFARPYGWYLDRVRGLFGVKPAHE